MRETLRTAFEQLTALGIGLVQAAIVFFIAALLARLLRRLARRQLKPSLVPDNVERLVESIVTIAIFGCGATILLTHWGVTWTTLLTAIGLSTLVVALGLQSVLQSLVAGIFILFERPFSEGDRISYSVHRVGGTVEEIALRTTVIRDDEGSRMVVPNSLVLTNAIINHSPERAIVTIIKVHGAGGDGRTVPETCALAVAALEDLTWPAARPEVTAHSSLGRFRLPGFIVRIPRLGSRLETWTREAVDESTQVRVIWTGVNDPKRRELVRQRLGTTFPGSRITIRRW